MRYQSFEALDAVPTGRPRASIISLTMNFNIEVLA